MGGMGVGLPVGGGIGGLVLLLLISWLTGTNPLDLISTSSVPQDQTVGTTGVRDKDPQAEFIAVVLADTEDTWRDVFRQRGQAYVPPVLVLFNDATRSACGVGRAEVGPFYCPADRKVYLDLSFFRELDERFGAPGDFAQAYVVAHEVGHHVQNLLGISESVAAARSRADDRQANALSVRLELQADCYAGVWGHYASARGLLESGDARGRIERRRGDRRRPAAADVARRSHSRNVHARIVRGSRALAAPRTRWRDDRELRYVLQRCALATKSGASCSCG